MIELYPGTADQNITYSDLAWTWWKMIDLHPGTARPEYSSNIFVHSDLGWTWWKMIELHPGTADQNITLILF